MTEYDKGVFRSFEGLEVLTHPRNKPWALQRRSFTRQGFSVARPVRAANVSYRHTVSRVRPYLYYQNTEVTAGPVTMTSTHALVLPLLLLLPLISAQTPHWGPCPEPPVQPGFIMKKFMGRWFEIAKLPAQFEKGGRCIETNFSMKADSSIRLVSSEILKGELRTMVGTGVTEDLKNPAKLGITFSYVLPYSPYWIMSTDYVNVALIYSCTDILRLFHVELAWIMGRTRTLPATTVDKAREVFTTNNIDISRMMPSKQQGCDKTL